jgi:endonuclease/exonuclease/phosphatase family metal-dependent hydrolase
MRGSRASATSTRPCRPCSGRRVTRTDNVDPPPAADARAHELLLADGPRLSHLYSAHPLSASDKRSIANLAVSASLAKEAFWSNDAGQIESTLQGDASAGLPPRPDRIAHELRGTLHHDIVQLAARPNAGQVLLLHHGTAFDDFAATEANLGTVLLPARTRLPPPSGALLRPASLRTAGLHVLGRALLPARPKLVPSEVPRFRVMTYNVHRCVGMDGRRSPHRIIQVLAEQEPDLVALQETGQDGEALQSDAIASEFGLHHVYVPTVSGGHDPYGHALFSRYPLEVMRVGLLPRSNAIRPWKEPRAAVWVKVTVAGRPVHVFSTHLGLVNADRTAQINALLGPDWIGGLKRDDAVILCGDFNLTPNGANYRRLISRLHDVQAGVSAGRHPKTFSTWHPIARLDHVFTSPHFRVERLSVPRTHLTRVASDHFPLVADLAWAAAPVRV